MTSDRRKSASADWPYMHLAINNVGVFLTEGADNGFRRQVELKGKEL